MTVTIACLDLSAWIAGTAFGTLIESKAVIAGALLHFVARVLEIPSTLPSFVSSAFVDGKLVCQNLQPGMMRLLDQPPKGAILGHFYVEELVARKLMVISVHYLT